MPQSAHSEAAIEKRAVAGNRDNFDRCSGGEKRWSNTLLHGAAWKKIPYGEQFDSLLSTVQSVSEMGLEVCCTLGSLEQDQAHALKLAAAFIIITWIRHEFYSEIITTRTYDERLGNIEKVRNAGMEVCSGGIIGMGESIDDRLKMLRELANMDLYPDSVPINALIACKGTPLESQKFVDSFEFVRIIATARILMPKAMVRLSADRTEMNEELQALCFLAGANSSWGTSF